MLRRLGVRLVRPANEPRTSVSGPDFGKFSSIDDVEGLLSILSHVSIGFGVGTKFPRYQSRNPCAIGVAGKWTPLFALAQRHTAGYTLSMKTAVSIPEPLFQAAEALAQRQHLSRSALYAKALRSYVLAEDARALTAAYDRLGSTENTALQAELLQAQTAILTDEGW